MKPPNLKKSGKRLLTNKNNGLWNFCQVLASIPPQSLRKMQK